MYPLHFRVLSGLLALSIILPGCDGTDDQSDIVVDVAIEGTGTGRIAALTVGLNIQCNVKDGVVTGTCSTTWTDRDGGLLRLEATPDAVTNFGWGGDCRGTANRICELTYLSGQDILFDVVGRFEAKTVMVVISPKPITMTAAGEDGAVVAQAQALDDNGAEIFGVDYSWTTSDASVVTVTPHANNRAATLEALKSGSAIISATAQGVTGQTQVDVSISN